MNQDESLLHEIMECTIPAPATAASPAAAAAARGLAAVQVGFGGAGETTVAAGGASATAAATGYTASFDMPPDSPALFPTTPVAGRNSSIHEQNIAAIALPSPFK